MFRRAQTFTDRCAAGRALGAQVAASRTHDPTTLVLGLARGGVPVAREVAVALDAPLDVLVVRKLGAPGQPEFAMGAVAAGETVINDDTPRRLGVTPAQLQRIVDAENHIRAEREQRYRAGREPLSLRGRSVILVDDGVATGATMAVAVRAARAAGAAAVTVAVPTGPADTMARFRADPEIDEVACVAMPEPFRAVGQSYDDFRQVDDGEVIRCLASS
ncbi:phosphoribosyltransferase family protein [Gordonia sp. CPCC 205515]|uniref:phosphoribosyltransferase n=1 Tax=Gordonia sp. CPCC 205515 TaxID=3140791 RepID=UPI003AF3583E